MSPVDGQDTVCRIIHCVSRQDKGIRCQVNGTGHGTHHGGVPFHEGYRFRGDIFAYNSFSANQCIFPNCTTRHNSTIPYAGIAANLSFSGDQRRAARPGMVSQKSPLCHYRAFAADSLCVDPGTIVFLRQIFLALDITAQGTGANGFAYSPKGADAVQAGIFGMFDVSDLILLRWRDLLHREVEVVILPEMHIQQAIFGFDFPLLEALAPTIRILAAQVIHELVPAGFREILVRPYRGAAIKPPIPNLHLFEQLRQDDSFSFDRSKIKFIGPTKELIVVATNLLHCSSVIIVLQQGRVFIFCLSDFCLCLRNQPGQHLLREGALPFQTFQHFILIAWKIKRAAKRNCPWYIRSFGQLYSTHCNWPIHEVLPAAVLRLVCRAVLGALLRASVSEFRRLLCPDAGAPRFRPLSVSAVLPVLLSFSAAQMP